MRVIEFNEYMRMFMEDGKDCGNVNYVDVYNMTEKLSVHSPSEANLLSFDQVHWSMEVNLMKVQLILQALSRGGADSSIPGLSPNNPKPSRGMLQ